MSATTVAFNQAPIVEKSSVLSPALKLDGEAEPDVVRFSVEGKFIGTRPVVRPALATAAEDDATRRLTSIPIVDISGLFSLSPSERQKAAQDLAKGCEAIGFIYLTGHGVPQELIDGVFDASKRYFALPHEQKMEKWTHSSKHLRGYEPMYEGHLDPRNRLGDRKEGFLMGYEPQLDPSPPATLTPAMKKQLDDRTNMFPDDTPWFRSPMNEYFTAVLDLSRRLMRAFGSALGVGEEYFDQVKFMDYPVHIAMKVHYYPPQETDDKEETGIGAHTDSTCFTLLQTDTPGLEVLNPLGQWVPAPPVPGAFIMNVGDFLMRLSNERFMSTVHRVRNLTGGDRYSIPFFFIPNLEASLEVLETCQSAENPAKFPAERVGEIYSKRHDAKIAKQRARAGKIGVVQEAVVVA